MIQSVRWPVPFRAAVSLTYDDGLPIHREHVAPLLEQRGLRATFYIPLVKDLHEHPERWRAVAAAGHELGNHTLFHPCRREPPAQYGWLDPSFDLAAYSPVRLRAELDAANLLLRLVDGRTDRTFGSTCCHTTFGPAGAEEPMAPILAEHFVAARGAQTQRHVRPDQGFDLFNIGCIQADGQSLAALQSLVTAAEAEGGWAVFMIHGVGADTHSLFVDETVHRHFVDWLAERPTVWTAPVREVAAALAAQGAAG